MFVVPYILVTDVFFILVQLKVKFLNVLEKFIRSTCFGRHSIRRQEHDLMMAGMAETTVVLPRH
jgi:hypothetical protein